MQRKETDAAGALGQDPLAGLQRAALEAVQSVPGSQTGAAQGAGFEEVEVRGRGYETLLVEDTVVAQCSVNGTTETSREGGGIERSGKMALVEESDDLVWECVSRDPVDVYANRYIPPALKRVTLLPTASTVPAPSDPGITLSLRGNGYPPLGMMRSR